jgi:[acyl-carrier-protein] S-malonyltransferase
MRTAMLFPGQGSQLVGMGADLAAAFPAARQVFARADAVLGYELSTLAFAGPLAMLTETRHAQPALLVHSVAVLRVLQEHGVEAAIVAGHSLGEYAALVAAGVLDFEPALQLVQRRGELMFACGERLPGAMAAIVGLQAEAVEAACGAVRDRGVCDLANLNAPDQIVVSGDVQAVDAALPLLQAAGARLVKRLNVSGAFHSALMREPAAEFARHLDAVTFRAARIPVLTNVGGRAEQDAERLRAALRQQMAAPVRWHESMLALRTAWDGPVLEVGAGSVLRGLLRRAAPDLRCACIGTRADVESLLQKPLPPAGEAALG